jgi:hypothetical protein
MASLIDFAETEKQRKVVESVLRTGSQVKACSELGLAKSTVNFHMQNARKSAAIRGWSPEHDMTKIVPEPYIVKGTSTLYDEDGKVKIQWVKTSVEHDKLIAMMREVVDELKQDVKPCKPIKLVAKPQLADLLNLYTLSDAHIGMLAWHEDGGADWDVRIAEQTILDAFCYLIANSPNARHGFFAQLGDGLHSDGMIPVTPGHGHVLDQDGRFHKVVRTAIRIFRTVITMLLEKHQEVTVLMAQGNHDPASSVWLQEMFALLFEKNKRVNIVVSPKPYYAHQHGDVMLGFHHGHKATPERLPDVFMGEFREMYGRTKQTFIHCGHRHGIKVTELNSAIVEQHRTLAARDAYASHGGYKSGRSMSVITYHAHKTIQHAETGYSL